MLNNNCTHQSYLMLNHNQDAADSELNVRMWSDLCSGYDWLTYFVCLGIYVTREHV